MPGGGSYVIAGLFSFIATGLLATVLSDGRGMLTADASNSITTAPYPYFNNTYGIGVFQDGLGRKWTEGEHVLKVDGCSEHRERGQAMCAFVFIGCVLSALAVPCCMMGAETAGQRSFVRAAEALLAAMIVCMILSISLFASFYAEPLPCTHYVASTLNGQTVLTDTTRDVTLKDTFNIAYGLPFLVVSACLAGLAILALLRIKKEENAQEPSVSPKEPIASPKEGE